MDAAARCPSKNRQEGDSVPAAELAEVREARLARSAYWLCMRSVRSICSWALMLPIRNEKSA